MSAANSDVNDLKVQGPVLAAGADGYDDERSGYQLMDPHAPAVIVGAAGEDDVREAVRHAAARGVRVAVQAGGHGLGAGLDGGVLISTRRMAGVRVDPAARTAWVEAGAPWQRVIEAAAEHGLAPLSGSSPGVGAVSYTLGGGVGLLARRYGFAADHVRRIDVVTADGRTRRVTAADPGGSDDADLFWALRGGGGNFGVVTGMEIDLVPVREIYGGGLYFAVDEVPGVLDAWRRWTETVPEEMTAALAMLPFPDLPMVPEPLRGRHVVQLQIAYSGPQDEARDLAAPLRALGTPLIDRLRTVPYTESATVFDEPDRPHAYRSSNRLVDGLDPRALEAAPKLAGPDAPAMCVFQIRHLGGALARPPRVPNAVGNRGAAYSVNVLSPVEPGEEAVVRDLHRDVLAPFAGRTVGRSFNFSFGPLDEDGVREVYEPGDYARLTGLKARFDPDGLFYANHPIPAR